MCVWTIEPFIMIGVICRNMANSKKTLVLGASENQARYSNMASIRLEEAGHEVVAVGARKGAIGEVVIETGQPAFKEVHTVTLYLNPSRQEQYYNYILSLKPRRIIFNPGTENPELAKLARNAGIETQEACTLVLLSINRY